MYRYDNMLTLRGTLLAACMLLLLSVGVPLAAAAHDTRHQADSCVCARAQVENGWCGHCSRGFVAGLEVRSLDLYEMVDPHGHDMDLPNLPCPRCVKAVKVDGFCEATGVGFVDGRGYVSRFAYLLARAGNTSPRDTDCGTCQSHLEHFGWCPRCGRGIIGSFTFERHADFVRAMKEYRRLEAAVATTADCELCGVAVFADGRCPACNIHYRDGARLRAGNRPLTIERGKLQ